MFESKWQAIVPAKGVHDSKTRLGRRDLTIPILSDVVAALLGCSAIAAIKVVTPDPVIAQLASSLNCEIVPETTGNGLTSAIQDGLSQCNAEGHDNVIVLLGDLPCLTSQHLDSFLMCGSQYETAFLSDTEGTGTTMWMRTTRHSKPPSFGVRSRAKHWESGAREIVGDLFIGARRDVDTAVNLWDAVRIGVGPATRAALAVQDSHPAEYEGSRRLLTISELNPLIGVDEAGNAHVIDNHSMPTLTNPRVGQRVISYRKRSL
jgi:2-phospho-L-lactate/phosphoenolpyruvate guanylyltransferase